MGRSSVSSSATTGASSSSSSSTRSSKPRRRASDGGASSSSLSDSWGAACCASASTMAALTSALRAPFTLMPPKAALSSFVMVFTVTFCKSCSRDTRAATHLRNSSSAGSVAWITFGDCTATGDGAFGRGDFGGGVGALGAGDQPSARGGEAAVLGGDTGDGADQASRDSGAPQASWDWSGLNSSADSSARSHAWEAGTSCVGAHSPSMSSWEVHSIGRAAAVAFVVGLRGVRVA